MKMLSDYFYFYFCRSLETLAFHTQYNNSKDDKETRRIFFLFELGDAKEVAKCAPCRTWLVLNDHRQPGIIKLSWVSLDRRKQ